MIWEIERKEDTKLGVLAKNVNVSIGGGGEESARVYSIE